jgi:zinc protease
MKFFKPIILSIISIFLANFAFANEKTSFDLERLSLTKGVVIRTLDNGLRVIIKEDRSIPLVGFAVAYRVGFRDEDPEGGNTGLTHLLEHMLFKGTKNYPKGEFDRIMTEIGARNNAYTSYEHTVYWQILPASGIDTAALLEADRMVNSLFDPDEFESETRVVISEITKYESNPYSQLRRKLYEEAFGEHPFSMLYGRIDDVKKADRDYVYNELYRKYYVPNNAFVVVTGDIDADEAFQTVKRHFGDITPGRLAQRTPNRLPQKTDVNVYMEGVASEDFGILLFHLPTFDMQDPDFIAMSFIDWAEIIGGFGYWSMIDGGLGFMRYSKDPDFPAETIDPDYIRENFDDFKMKLFNQERMRYDSVNGLMRTLIGLEGWIGIDNYEKLIAEFEKLTADDILRVIQRYLTKENSVNGFFRAKTRDRHAQPQAISTTDERKGGDIDYSVFENPTDEQIASIRELNANQTQSSFASLTEYFETVRVETLPNGITLIFRPFSMNDKVVIRVGVDAGSVFQTKPYQANFTHNFVFNGGPQIYLKNELTRRGVSFGGNPGTDFVTYNIDTPVENFADAVKYISLALENRKFIPVVLEEFKFNSINRLRLLQNNPTPDAQADFGINKLIYGNKGAGLDSHASKRDIVRLSLSDIEDFYVSFYRPENTVITVVGNVDFDIVLKTVSSELGVWEQKPPRMNTNPSSLETPRRDITKRVTLDTMQSVVMKASPTVDYIDKTNYAAFSLGNLILGGAFSARLMRIIRDREGLTYGVYTFPRTYREQAAIFLYMQNSPDDIGRALDIFYSEVDRFLSDGPTEYEIFHFKNRFINSLIFNYDNANSIANSFLRYQMMRGNPLYDLEFIGILDSIDRDTVIKAMRKYFPKNFFTVIAGK